MPAVALFEGRAERWNEEGVRLAEGGHHDEAIRSFARAVKADPRLGKAYYNMGLSYMHLRHSTQAVSCFRTALEVDPGDVGASAALTTYLRPVDHRRSAYPHSYRP